MNLSQIIKSLSSVNDKNQRDKAIEILYSNLGDVKKLVMPKEGMSCWKNAAYVLKIIGRPHIDPAVPDMFCWIRDKSYPGADIVYSVLLTSLPRLNLAEHLEIAVHKAVCQGDISWLYNLSELAKDAKLNKNDFLDKKIYDYIELILSGKDIEINFNPNNEYDNFLKRKILSGELKNEYSIDWSKKRRTLRY